MASKHILNETVTLEGHIVTILDNEWYAQISLAFESLEKASQCFTDTVAILTEAYNKLGEAGWNQSPEWSRLAAEDE